MSIEQFYFCEFDTTPSYNWNPPETSLIGSDEIHLVQPESEKSEEEKWRRQALEDELTGLNNRRGFFTLAEQAIKTALRRKQRVSLLFADLDGLKKNQLYFWTSRRRSGSSRNSSNFRINCP